MLPLPSPMLTVVVASGGALTPGTQTYSYTGATEEYTVPSGASQIEFKRWGAGGSGGLYNTGSWGGGGGFTTGKLAVVPGDIIRIQVPQGGQSPADSTHGGLGGWPDGGTGTRGDAYGGGGGGSARLWKNGALKAVAGGGGGGGGYSGGGSAGAGGGSSGQNATLSGTGTGGSQVAGGRDANDSNVNKIGLQISTETNRTGAWGGSNADFSSTLDDGGGGGGGYWGGGGGGGDGGSAGGGSGYLHADCTAASTTAGSGKTPAGTSDTNYPGGNTGYGSDSLGYPPYATNPGNNGYVWMSVT